MRTRKEIEDAAFWNTTEDVAEINMELVIELLLDIRDVLEERKNVKEG